VYFWQMRVHLFRSYISDLTDQNNILVKTVEDLEADANVRVARLEAKLQKASSDIQASHNTHTHTRFVALCLGVPG